MDGEYKQAFEKVMDFLRFEFSKIRTGRAHTSLVENIEVEAYGAMTPLNQLASISVPEPRTIAIAPWDKSVLIPMEKALQQSDIGVNPVNDGDIIRIILPSLTEESRRELVKRVNGKAEEARIRVRNVREETLKSYEKQENSGEISEDEKFQKKEMLQKSVDVYNEKIELLRKEKEQEVMTV